MRFYAGDVDKAFAEWKESFDDEEDWKHHFCDFLIFSHHKQQSTENEAAVKSQLLDLYNQRKQKLLNEANWSERYGFSQGLADDNRKRAAGGWDAVLNKRRKGE